MTNKLPRQRNVMTKGKRARIQQLYNTFRDRGSFTVSDVMEQLGISRRYARDLLNLLSSFHAITQDWDNYTIDHSHRPVYQELGLELEFNRDDLTSFVSSLLRTFPEKEILPTLLEFVRQAKVDPMQNRIPRFSTGQS